MSPSWSSPLLVLGLMSGTSADGIDVALARISGCPPRLRAKLENFACVPYPRQVRAAILRLAEAARATPGEISQLNFLLGELFARAALAACRRFRVHPRHVALIGSHGQTIYHQGTEARVLGAKRVASTLQIGELAVIAERTGITTVGDFRPADIAAGGRGAPLVPFVDYMLYRHPRRGRVALNLGGIANLTAIPPAARPEEVFAFDTGPGNMVIDALVSKFTGSRLLFDRHAGMARRGRLDRRLLARLLDAEYFRRPPPKSAGHEQFGKAYVKRLFEWAQRRKLRPEDLVCTVTVFTAVSVVFALRRWVLHRLPVHDLIVSGGGAHNPFLLAQLQAGLPGVEMLSSAAFGVPEDAKEAFAFAILAYETFHGRPAHLPGATGAKHPVILGKMVHAPPKAARIRLHR